MEKKYCEIFEYTVNQNISLQNIIEIIEYASVMPEINTKIVKIFFNILWNDNKNRFLINTINATINVKINSKIIIVRFYNFFVIQNKLLNLINLSQKYNFTNKKELQQTSE